MAGEGLFQEMSRDWPDYDKLRADLAAMTPEARLAATQHYMERKLNWCEVDDQPASICGGPHFEIVIQDGDKLVITKAQADILDASGIGGATYDKTLGEIMDIIGPPKSVTLTPGPPHYPPPGIYDQMIIRTTDGSDPLVQEPGP